jgi:glycosyltransferase involved in cell wall biosynthesis
MGKKLVIFTIAYPDFLLDKELKFLAESFDTIYLLPGIVCDDKQSTYNNVKVVSIFKKTDLRNYISLIAKHFFSICRIYGWMLLKTPYRRAYLQYIKSFLGHLLNELEKVKPLKAFIENEKLNNAIFYDYWLVDSTLALAELKRRKIIHHVVARAHGFDLYHERQFETHVPYQDYRIQYLHTLYTISLHGYNYLKSRLAKELAQKVKLSYLGITNSYQKILSRPQREKFFIISCARLIPLKRIDLLVDVLKLSVLPVHWVHFGDGPEFGKVHEKSKELPSNVSYELMGDRKNEKIMSFYAENYVDLFVSLSTSEGLPVSMMEAISFGVPIMSCSVNGIPEIVTPQTGVLIDLAADAVTIKELLEDTLLNRKFDRSGIVDFFERNFNARSNFANFIHDIREK